MKFPQVMLVLQLSWRCSRSSSWLSLPMSFVDGKLRPVVASVAVLVHLFAILFLGFIAYYSSRLAISSFERGVTSQANSSIQLWWLQVAIPFGAAAMIFVLTPGLIRNFSVVISNVNRLIQTSQGQKK